MEDERPYKKRTLSSRMLAVAGDEFKLGSSAQKLMLIHQRQQIETLEAELEHERSTVQLNDQQSKQAIRRLEQHLDLVRKDAAAEKKLLEDRLGAREERIEMLTLSRDQTMQMNQQLQFQLQEAEEQLMEASSNQDQHTIRLLEDKLQAAEEREDQYKKELESLRTETERRLQVIVNTDKEALQVQQRLVEQAPPEILSELSRSRVKLAEQERTNRTLKRHFDDAKKRNIQLLGELEAFQTKVSSVGALTTERDAAVHDLNVALAELTVWKEFGKDANSWMNRQSSGPPEVSSIRRFLEASQSSVDSMSKQNKTLLSRCEELQQKLVKEQEKSCSFRDAVDNQKRKEAEWESRHARLQEQLKVALKQSELYQRENDSLQTLMKTFELQLGKKVAKEEDQLNPTLQTLGIQLEASQARCTDLQESHDTLTKHLEDIKKNEEDLKTELERVKDKFEKLREALVKEREKVSDAEARAVDAEQLAAKGSFNPSTTRVLHFSETPMEIALKEEVAVLKRLLETKVATTGAGIEPGKVHDRLQQTFKAQIGMFREGVHLITGFKIDMLNYNAEPDHPTFRLRSMFAESEGDDLMFRWPKAKDGKVESLDLLSTDFAKSLTRTPSYDYVTKYNSLPAFTASLQLSLFEKQTMMI